jgi:hypothetical protein
LQYDQRESAQIRLPSMRPLLLASGQFRTGPAGR